MKKVFRRLAQVAALACAAMVATCALAGSAWADDVALTLNVHNTQSDTTKQVTWTRAQLETLAQANEGEGEVSAQNWGVNGSGTEQSVVFTSKSYVTLAQLFADAGVYVQNADTITVNAGSDYAVTATEWSKLQSQKFFPCAGSAGEEDRYSTESAQDVQPLISLASTSSSLSADVKTAGDAAAANAQAEESAWETSLRYFCGIATEDFNADNKGQVDVMGGHRFANGVTAITVEASGPRFKVDMSKVKFASKTCTYDGTYKSIEATNLPAAVSVTYAVSSATATGTYLGHNAIEAGKYTVTATFSFAVPGAENVYMPVSPMTAKLTINKAKQSKAKISTRALKKVKVSTTKKKTKKFDLDSKYVKDSAKVKWSKVSGSKKVTVKNGKLVVKKGTKKGYYKVKVKMKVAATANYKKKTITKNIKVKVY